MASRNASMVLFSLLLTIGLFAAFALVIQLPGLSKHSYSLDYGWSTPVPASVPIGECDRALTTKGFPITTSRPSRSDSSGCLDEKNFLAKNMNLALCFAAAVLISVAATEVVRRHHE